VEALRNVGAHTLLFVRLRRRGIHKTTDAILLLLRRPFDGWNGIKDVDALSHGAIEPLFSSSVMRFRKIRVFNGAVVD
jgi:hypothetical protein